MAAAVGKSEGPSLRTEDDYNYLSCNGDPHKTLSSLPAAQLE